VLLLGCGDKYASGTYHLASMTVIARARSPSDFPPPLVPLSTRDTLPLDTAGFVGIDTRCHKTLATDQARVFSVLANRGATQLWMRTDTPTTSVPPDDSALGP